MSQLIHTTDRMVFKSCRMKWDFTSSLRRNLQSPRAGTALTFGTAWHAGLESYYDPRHGERDIERAKHALSESLKLWFMGLPSPSTEDEMEYDEGRMLGLQMLDNYGEYARKHDRFNVLWVEQAFEIPIPGTSLRYSLKPDAVVEDFSNRIWVMEHKSADKLPDNTEYLLMDEQCGSYIWGVQQAKGIRAEGVLYNIARKRVPGKLKVLKNGNLSTDKRTIISYDAAKAQIIGHYGSIPPDYQEYLEYLQGKAEQFFYRENVRRNAREIEYLAKMIAVEANEMTDPNIAIYRNPNRFNCSGCAFVGPCLSKYEGGDYEGMLKGNYIPRKMH